MRYYLRRVVISKKIILAVLLGAIFLWWWLSAPPDDFRIGEAYQLGEIPEEILSATKEDIISSSLQNTGNQFSGFDDITFTKDSATAYLSVMDGSIWEYSIENSKFSKLVDTPFIPAGIQLNPLDESQLYFCVSKMGGRKDSKTEKVGLYRLDLNTNLITPIVLDLPIFKEYPVATSFTPKTRPSMRLAEFTKENSRPFHLCNDIAISMDGKRIYLSEPIPLARAAMGSGAVIEAIGLAPIGKLWLYDVEHQSISLIADNFTFVDGLLLEESSNGDESILFTETTKFRLMRSYIEGEKAGITEIVWDNLPGMPDGLDRDKDGNIWIGLIKKRTEKMQTIHATPWLKSLLVRLPHKLLPVSKQTGLMALSADAKQVLFYSMHDGSRVSDISVISPYQGLLFLPIFNADFKGVYFIKNPLCKQNCDFKINIP